MMAILEPAPIKEIKKLWKIGRRKDSILNQRSANLHNLSSQMNIWKTGMSIHELKWNFKNSKQKSRRSLNKAK